MSAIGEASITGVSLLSSSSGGVTSSGSILSKDVRREISDASDSRTAAGGYDGFVMVIAAGGARRTCVSSSIGVDDCGSVDSEDATSGLA